MEEITLKLKNLTLDSLLNHAEADENALIKEQIEKVVGEYRPRLNDPLGQAMAAEIFAILK